jgi:hypothetical protein
VNGAALEGHLDEIQRGLLRGWALDPAIPDQRVSLLITADGVLVGRVLANRFRPHLHATGRSDGRHGFELFIAPPLSPLKTHVIGVRREQDGAHVPGSPVAMAGAVHFDLSMQGQLAQILADAADLAELEERLAFLAAQTETLLQRHATQTRSAQATDSLARHRFRWATPEATAQPPGRTVLLLAETMPQQNSDHVAHLAFDLYGLGLDVSLVAANHAGAPPPDLPAILHHPPWVASVEETLARQAGIFDAVVLCTLSVAVRYAGLLRHHQPQALLFLVLPHGLRHDALALQAYDENRPDLLEQAGKVLAHELRAIRDVDVVVGDISTVAHLVPGTSSALDLAAAFAAFSPTRSDSE